MYPNWLQSLFYGLISGFSEFLPVSSEAHRGIFLMLTGKADEPGLRLAVRIGALLALLFICWPMIARITREKRLSRIPAKRRKRQPDLRYLLDLRFVKAAAIPMLIAFIFHGAVHDLYERLWILGIFLCINGVALYVPQFLTRANKDSLSMSALDAVLVGINAAFGVIPGMSRVGLTVSCAQIRGGERKFNLDMALLLCIPALIVLSAIDVFAFMGALQTVTFLSILRYLTAGIAAFGSGYAAIYLMRFLSVRAGFSGFAYYSWGLGLFTFILYLSV